MECREGLLVQPGFEVDEQIAATDEVHARERRVGDKVLAGENDHLAQRLDDAIATLLLYEKAAQTLRRNVLDEGFGVKTVARFVQQVIVEVSGEHLKSARSHRVLC